MPSPPLKVTKPDVQISTVTRRRPPEAAGGGRGDDHDGHNGHDEVIRESLVHSPASHSRR